MHARLQPTYRESGGQSHYEYHAQSHQITQDGLENTGEYNDLCSCQLYHLHSHCNQAEYIADALDAVQIKLIGSVSCTSLKFGAAHDIQVSKACTD